MIEFGSGQFTRKIKRKYTNLRTYATTCPCGYRVADTQLVRDDVHVNLQPIFDC